MRNHTALVTIRGKFQRKSFKGIKYHLRNKNGFSNKREVSMDIIKAVEDFSNYHSMTGQSREEWQAWRVQAVEEWMLDKEILGKESERDGSSESEPDNSGNDGVLSVSTGDCGQGRGERQHSLQDAAWVPGEDGQIRESVFRPGDSSGGCH